MITNKDCELIAKELKKSYSDWNTLEIELIVRLCRSFHKLNPKFNTSKFLKVIGLEPKYSAWLNTFKIDGKF